MYEKPTVSPDLPQAVALEAFGPGLEFARPLAPLTSFRTGGPARYFLEVTSGEVLSQALRAADQRRMPVFVMGGGSNLLVADSGYDGLVIRIDIRGLELVNETVIECGAGERLSDLVEFAVVNNLTGLEFASGIWGSVGGAIYGNAGAYGCEVGSVLKELTLVSPNGEMRKESSGYCAFGYRTSRLKESGEAIVTAFFELQKDAEVRIRERGNEILLSRADKHPVDHTAGCFFKNFVDPSRPHGKLPAGRLLEEAGVGGMRVGGARVYEKHANIIVTEAGATSKDIRLLADMMKEKVRERFGIELREEVQQLGSFE